MPVEIRQLKDKHTGDAFVPVTHWDAVAGKPTIPGSISLVQSDWSLSNNSEVDYIKNKPTLASVATSGSYNDLSNKPTIPNALVNADWNSSSGISEILNKPTLSTVATSGSYNDLSNKPNLATVATSGSYSDLSNKPIIPTKTSDLTNDSGFVTSASDTKNTAGATDSSSKLYLIGALTQNDNPQTYTNSEVYGTNGTLHASKLEIGSGTVIGENGTAFGEKTSYTFTGSWENHSNTITVTSSTNFISALSAGNIITITISTITPPLQQTVLRREIVSVNSTNGTITVDSELPVLDSTLTYQLSIERGIAYGDYSNSEGYNTNALGEGSHAEGRGSLQSEGYQYGALGDYSHSEGDRTNAVGDYSHVEGQLTAASGVASHAEGKSSQAGGNYSHTEGLSTVTTNPYEHAEGRLNKSHRLDSGHELSSGNTIHSIGIGKSANNLSLANALEVMQNGDVYIKGIGNYDGEHIKLETGHTSTKTLQDLVKPATTSALGLVKIGSGLSVTNDGEISTNNSGVPVGTVAMWPTRTAPNGWHLCNGSAIGYSKYSSGDDAAAYEPEDLELVNVLKKNQNTRGYIKATIGDDTGYVVGTYSSSSNIITVTGLEHYPEDADLFTYTGNSTNLLIYHGSTYSGTWYMQVCLPNFSGRFPLGTGLSTVEGNTNHLLGSTGGKETVTLTAAQSGLPAHTHPIKEGANNIDVAIILSNLTYGDRSLNSGKGSSTFVTVGQNTAQPASLAHTNMPPYLTINFIIKYA